MSTLFGASLRKKNTCLHVKLPVGTRSKFPVYCSAKTLRCYVGTTLDADVALVQDLCVSALSVMEEPSINLPNFLNSMEEFIPTVRDERLWKKTGYIIK
jgi:hypothetical protein